LKRATRMLIGFGCMALLLISWVVAITADSDYERQDMLIRQALSLTNDGIYIRAVPLLEEAVGFNTTRTIEAETELKRVYLALIEQPGFRRRYTELLSRQMNRADATAEIFAEAAEYFLSISRLNEALNILIEGISRTGSQHLIDMYEAHRYAFTINRTGFEDVTAIFGSTIQVKMDGYWGLASADGTLLIPAEYEKISTFSVDRAIVMRDGVISAVDRNNNRIALLHEDATDFGNFADNRLPLIIDGRWYRATGEFEMGIADFEMVGMHSEGNAAAKQGGRWGVIDGGANWIIPPEHDGIIKDELGRAFGQGAVFVRNGSSVTLLVNGERVGSAFEDARPFGREGYAAVKSDGRWGFINTAGEVVIDFRFEDALSFGQHMAAVKINGLWGYISLLGNEAIEPQFLQAKSFSDGSAPVLTERGWQFITLIEFRRGAGL